MTDDLTFKELPPGRHQGTVEKIARRRPAPPVTATNAETRAWAPRHVLHRDYETRSLASLQKVGASKYAAGPSTEILCAAHVADDGPVQLWSPRDPVPREFFEAASNSNCRGAHNDAFKTAIERVLHLRHGFPRIPLERHRCTQAMCPALGPPARLSVAADALELKNRKDAAGERLMHQMSKPRCARQGENSAAVHWFADRRQRLYNYCRRDVEVERELHDRLRPSSKAEHALWAPWINERGFHIDRQFAEAARRIASPAKRKRPRS
jgi:DNA polymerase